MFDRVLDAPLKQVQITIQFFFKQLSIVSKFVLDASIQLTFSCSKSAYSKLTLKTPVSDVVLMFLLLTLYIFHNFS